MGRICSTYGDEKICTKFLPENLKVINQLGDFHLNLPNGHSSRGFPNKITYAFIVSPTPAIFIILKWILRK